jgi:hypothetical protein
MVDAARTARLSTMLSAQNDDERGNGESDLMGSC